MQHERMEGSQMDAFFMCARHGNYLGGESPLWG